MRRRGAVSMIVAALLAWLVPQPARADLKLATLSVKGMVCHA